MLDIKQEATTQKAVPGKPSIWETGSYNNTDSSNTDLNNIEKTNIKGAFKKQNALDVRYKSKEEFLKDFNTEFNSNEHKVSNIIYNEFYTKLNCNHYKLNTEQIEKINQGIDLILSEIQTCSQLDISLKNYSYLERQYYSIQDFTDLNTLAYLLSITGIEEISERFDKDGNFIGVI